MAQVRMPTVEMPKRRRPPLERRLGLEHSMFWSTAFRTLRAPGGLLGLIIILGMLLISIAAPLFAPSVRSSSVPQSRLLW